jgi:hypothetical protein
MDRLFVVPAVSVGTSRAVLVADRSTCPRHVPGGRGPQPPRTLKQGQGKQRGGRARGMSRVRDRGEVDLPSAFHVGAWPADEPGPPARARQAELRSVAFGDLPRPATPEPPSFPTPT